MQHLDEFTKLNWVFPLQTELTLFDVWDDMDNAGGN